MISELRSILTKKTASLCLLWLSIMVSSVPVAFTAYANAFKVRFNMTQTQVETLSSVTYTSASFLVPAGVVYDEYGMIQCMIISLVVYTGALGLVWAVTVGTTRLTGATWMLCVFMAFVGHGRTYTFVAALTESLSQIHTDEAKFAILVLSDTMVEIGAMVYVCFYQWFAVRGHVLDAENQLLSMFFLYAIPLVMVVYTVTILCWSYTAGGSSHGELTLEDAYTECNGVTSGDVMGGHNNIQHISNDRSTPCDTRKRNNPTENTTTKQKGQQRGDNVSLTYCDSTPLVERRNVEDHVLLTWKYQLLFWATVLTATVASFISLNLTFITHSLSLHQYDSALILLHRLVVIISRLGLGLAVAFGKRSRMTGEFAILFVNILVLLGVVCLMVQAENIIFVFLTVIGSATAHGTLYVITPMLIIDYYGMNKFGRNMSLVSSAISVLTTAIQVVFAKFYESVIAGGDANDCYGQRCIANTIYSTVAMSGIGTLLAAVIFIIKVKFRE